MVNSSQDVPVDNLTTYTTNMRIAQSKQKLESISRGPAGAEAGVRNDDASAYLFMA